MCGTWRTGQIIGGMLLPAAKPQEAFDARPLFRRVRGSLLGLLQSLGSGDWQASTVAEPWLVRDLVAHLVGDDLARISRSRDTHVPGQPADGEPLALFLDRHNAEWVAATQRISPQVLTELLTWTSGQVFEFWSAENLEAFGEPVSWVGSGPAPAWLDCARDFTEDWVHQQQIREAVCSPAGYDPATVGAVIDTFMHAVPRTLDGHAPQMGADSAATISIVVSDETGPTEWTWVSDAGTWTSTSRTLQPTATVACNTETWWRLCVRMITPDEARAQSQVTGDLELGNAALDTIAIIRSS
jgi:uncharacterized protein (TIGR03083 family)